MFRGYSYVSLGICLLTFLLFAPVSFGADDQSVGLSETAVKIPYQVDIGRMRKDIARLSNLSTRVTGYPESASASKYIYDRFVETGLQNVESREFPITVPIDHGDGKMELLAQDGALLKTYKIWPLWPNLVRTSLLPTGLSHLVEEGETLESIAKSYQVDAQAILTDSHNQYLRDQATDGRDNDSDGDVDEPGELALVEGNPVFIPTGGLTAPLFYAGNGQLGNFNGKDIGGFWYKIQSDDTLKDIAHRYRIGVGSITDDVLNSHLQKTEDGIDNNEDGQIDEYGEIPPLTEILNWGTDGIDNDGDGYVDEQPGDDTDGVDNNNDGQIDEEGEFVAAAESSIFIPRGSVVLIDFNSSTKWINAAMLGSKAILFIEPETTIRGEAENKFLTVPANIPRFWISKADAGELLAMLGESTDIVTQQPLSLSARLTSTIKWERRIGQNIRGFLEGGDPALKDELVVITAYYDAMSVVPAMAPGADPTGGIAALLELARIFSQREFRPGRSILFVAMDAHFQGLAGMRAFMEGIGQDIVGRESDSPGTPTMRGLQRGLSTDLFEFEELGRKLLLSIDRNVLVDLPPDFFYEVHQLDENLDSLGTTLADLEITKGNIDGLRNAQRDAKEKEKKKLETTKKREKQRFTEEEKSRLEVNLAKFKKDALQTTQFLQSMVYRLAKLRSQALNESRKAQRELIEQIALPMARLDLWAIEKLEADLKAKRIGGSYNRTPDSSYLTPKKREDGHYYLPVPGNLPPGLAADIQQLSEALEDWELSDPRKFTLQYCQERLLDRHLDFKGLERIKQARKVAGRATQALPEYIATERQLLKEALAQIPTENDAQNRIRETITRLEGDPAYAPKARVEELKLYLSESTLKQFKIIQDQLQQKIAMTNDKQGTSRKLDMVLIADLTKDKQSILEIAMRNARLERQRIESLLTRHASLVRPYLAEEELVLRHYLSDDAADRAMKARAQIFAHLEEASLLDSVKKRARHDLVDLQNLLNILDRLDRDLDEEMKIILRDNLLTMRNARFRNLQKRVEKISRISESEYNRKIRSIKQAIALQDLFNRYYTSLFVAIDLSSQSGKFGVFNKGWFYDQQPEFVLRREFATIGNKLMEYANQADFGERIRKLWTFTDDQIRQAVMNSQWGVASSIEVKKAIDGKSLETLITEHYETLLGLSGVSRLMKMQFEQMKNRGEPSEDMLKDMDYIRKEVERFIRNDIREARKERKNNIRLRERLDAMLALRHEEASALTEEEIDDIKTLIGIAGLGGVTNFVNAISASGGKTWKTYIPGKIAFDSEVATLTGFTGIAFATIEDARVLTDTPLDTIDRMDLREDGNLHQQVKTLAAVLIQAMRDPKMPTAARVGNFYCNLFGDVVEYDARESALPNKPVPYAILTLRRQHKTMMGVRGDLFTIGDNKGNFEVAGLAMEGRATIRKGGTQEVEAYILDSDSGDIVYAPDLGNFGAKLLPNLIPINTHRRGCRIVVFPCVSTTIYDLVDQRYLRTLRELEVYNAASDSTPEKYGVSKPWQQEGMSATEPIALVYSEPNSRIKIGMAYGQIGKRLLLIKAGKSGTKNPILYTGEGFVVRENGSIRLTPYVVVRDMWWLDENRSRLYKRFGISSDRLDQLHQFANEHLHQAERALAKKDYQQALKLARAAWGYESRAYPDVKKTGNDVVNGVMFYLALLLPFSYFMERLLFAFPNIHKQIVGTFAIFLVVFFFLSQVHPAFQITTTPIIILIAFIVLALTAFVIIIIVRKFEEQLEQMKQEGSKVYKADVGRLSASAVAFRLGISNMRKRKGRTILTCVTLIILTFTVISFTSVRTFMQPNRTNLPSVTPRYTGMLIRDQYWSPLEEPVITSILNDLQITRIPEKNLRALKKQQLKKQGKSPEQIESILAQLLAQLRQHGALTGLDADAMLEVHNVVAPRAWYQSAGTGDQSFVQLTRVGNPKDPAPPVNTATGEPLTYSANMLVGMSPDEPGATGIDRYLQYGKWYNPADEADWPTRWPYVCVLPKGMADLLGITEEDMGKATVSVYGADFTVTGILGIGFKDLTDNDGEELTPVDYQLMQQQQSRGGGGGGQAGEALEGELEKYIHLTPDSIAILPYEVVMNQGGTLRSVSVNMEPQPGDPPALSATDKLDLIMAPLMNRIALDFFVGRDRDTYLYSSIGMTSFSGMGNLFVPILIASLIVLNTMLGAVYERVREISIYSSVGLAPVHIAFLFLAEACVYAVIGAVIGYLLGQIVATLLVQFGWLSGLTLNYSSMSTVVATIIVMVVVVGSTMYPAVKASRMAVPDIERKWKLPEPEGDEWHFDLPFTVLAEESLGMNIFMRDYFEAHADESASDFYADQVTFSRSTETVDNTEDESYSIGMMVWLAPYDLGVSQAIKLVTSPVGEEEEELYRITLDVHRESGEIASWKRVNRRLLNLVRKQLLIWRTFSAEVRGEFHERGREEREAEAAPRVGALAPQPAD
ncbi:MAG: LysM peptidoglycan-binding domain-containing protein [Candidatus Poribacteria bacterium]|nr:LysM peptidoglycan-binding domain-containing protein [Candidatus Poribacteria bacterium]